MPHLLSLNGHVLVHKKGAAYLKALGFLLRWGDKVLAASFLIHSSILQKRTTFTTSHMEGLLMGRVLVHNRATLNSNTKLLT